MKDFYFAGFNLKLYQNVALNHKTSVDGVLCSMCMRQPVVSAAFSRVYSIVGVNIACLVGVMTGRTNKQLQNHSEIVIIRPTCREHRYSDR